MSRVKARDYYTIEYSYEVAGRRHTGELVTTTNMGGPGSTTVTYAKSDPSVSTLQPEKVDSIYRVSVIVVAVALLPVLTLIGVWFKRRMAGS